MPKKKKKHIPIEIKVILIVLITAIILTAVFGLVGMYYRDDLRIYPNISIAKIDVSRLTREEAAQALDLHKFEQRSKNARVTIIFPDDTEMTITGEDVQLTNDALLVIGDALDFGRGRGIFTDTVSLLWRHVASRHHFDIKHEYNLESLHTIVAAFTDDYNKRMESLEPIINDEKLIITKGAGQTLADEQVLKDHAYTGLFDSFDNGHPVEIVYSLPEITTDMTALTALHRDICVPAKSAEFDYETNMIKSCVVGIDFDLLHAYDQLSATESGKTTAIDLIFTQPEITREHLESLLFRDLLGEETTWVHGSADRVTNIRLSSEAIDGFVLRPGYEFSFNEVVGVRSSSLGYRAAGAYVNGRTVSVIGGGICQTSSTIYSAIMDTHLLVTERHQHGKPVPYLQWGRDATVFWGSLDFKFANNTEYPIRIDITLVDRYLTARVYGTIIDDFPTPSQAG